MIHAALGPSLLASLLASVLVGCTGQPSVEPPAPPTARMWPDPDPSASPAPGGSFVVVLESFDLGTYAGPLAEGEPSRGPWYEIAYDYDHDAAVEGDALCVGASALRESQWELRAHDEDNAFLFLAAQALASLLSGGEFVHLNEAETTLFRSGRAGVALRVSGLSADDASPGSSFEGATIELLTVSSNGDGERWDVISSSFVSPGIEQPRASGEAYATDGTLVSLAQGVLGLPIGSGDALLELPVARPVVVFEPSAGGRWHGTISGIVGREATRALMAQGATYAHSYGACGAARYLLDAGIPALPDYLIDGAHDPSRPCDAFTIAIGFDAVLAELSGDVVDPEPLPPKLCEL